MRARWSQRRAWVVWIFASLASWVAIIFFSFWFTQDENLIANEVDLLAPSNISPAAGPNGRADSN